MEGVGAIFVDVDKLKEINDVHGHLEGDFAIRTSVELIRAALRKTDVIGRFGGDEFVVVFHDMDRVMMDKLIERIERNFLEFNRCTKKAYCLECSFGGDIFDPEKDTMDSFLQRVDQIMYSNKQQKKKGGGTAGDLPCEQSEWEP